MVQQKLLKVSLIMLLAVAVLFTACESSDVSNGTEGTGTLEVLLHDAPANYEEVNISIERVEVNNTETNNGWIDMGAPDEPIDLLKLTNGNMEVIGSRDLEPGKYNQIRLILNNDENSLVVDGEEHELFVPSGEQTGIKINVGAEIEEGIVYTILLDFDAARSIVERGNEQSGIDYLLKPVIKATSEAVSGRVAGAIEPVEAQPWVYAIANDDTVSTTKANSSDGTFQLIGLEEGTYTISADPTNEDYRSTDTTGIEVTTEETTDIGTIELEASE